MDLDNHSLESMIDPSGAIEGARMNSDLYDAYSNPSPRPSSIFRPILLLSWIVLSLDGSSPDCPHSARVALLDQHSLNFSISLTVWSSFSPFIPRAYDDLSVSWGSLLSYNAPRLSYI
jgi:hypothetical protein